ncbi:MAG: hypothetical protein L0338_39655 [Acidobacteria bacterium]|nr:hypothetical protein [Acidobacteriota bacterium]
MPLQPDQTTSPQPLEIPPLSIPAGSVVEKEGDIAPPGTTSEFGENFEDLNLKRPDLVNSLLQMVQQFSTEDYHARRDEIKRIREAREFWKGLHYLWWDEENQNWQLPFQVAGQKPKDSDELPRYSYVTNFYQAFGLSIIAVLSKRPPNVKLWPQSSKQPEDVATAKTGTTIIELIQKNNRISQLLIEMSYYLWTDGTVGGYVRYVVDGDRFGYHKESEMGEVMRTMGMDKFTCPECGAENPVTGPNRPLLNFCAQCGEYMDDASFTPAPQVPVPFVKNTVDMPNGQEEITVVSKLELKIPNWATRFTDFPYLQWQTEAHASKLKAMFQKAAKAIAVQSGGVGTIGTDYHERETRLSLKSGTLSAVQGDPSNNLITFTRTWLRPWAFWLIDEDSKREELLGLFPKGCYVAFAGDTFCEARNESMNDHWRILHAYPGDGQSRPAIGDSIIPVNKRFNDLSNIQQETYEFGIPPTYIDNNLLDRQAIGSQKCLPGSFYFLKGRPGTSIREGVYTPPPSQITPDMVNHMADLMGPIAQFLTGGFPALFGGEMEHTETASGYAMARDQAMGRLGLVWEAIKWFWSEVMMLGIECFRKNRSDDVEIPLEGPGGQWDAKWIRTADLRGSLFATPETDESFPQTWAQLRATVMQLMESQDPYVQEILGFSPNVSLSKRLLGLDQFQLPDEDSETKQYREITMLMGSSPLVVPGQPQLDDKGKPVLAADGMAAVTPPSFIPSVPVDAVVDNHQVEAEVCRRFLNSPEGQLAKYENPGGYANVRAHLMAHDEQAMQRALQQAMLAAPAGPASLKQPSPSGGGQR